MLPTPIPCGLGHPTLVGTIPWGGGRGKSCKYGQKPHRICAALLGSHDPFHPHPQPHRTHNTSNSHTSQPSSLPKPAHSPCSGPILDSPVLISRLTDSPRVQVHSHILYQLVTDTGNLRDIWNHCPIRRPYQTKRLLSLSPCGLITLTP